MPQVEHQAQSWAQSQTQSRAQGRAQSQAQSRVWSQAQSQVEPGTGQSIELCTELGTARSTSAFHGYTLHVAIRALDVCLHVHITHTYRASTRVQMCLRDS